MNSTDTSLSASFWVMVLLQTLGSVDMPGKGPRKMPSPRAYLAIIIAWGVLHILSDVGQERAASIFGWLLVLTGIVVGPFGKQLSNFLNNVAVRLAPSQINPNLLNQTLANQSTGTS